MLKYPLYQFCNAFHQVKFQKSLKDRFEENFKNVHYGPENTLLIPLWAK